ncbi:helix-turn-helix transcriptional regulator [Serratia sp. JSRIV006]|uniref:helix-turn-helix domain-containing protein n=1 Tax=Serratia sp. JSRIV006 TaxID=2831896 RepID=UPI001CC1455F|nr:helix-turn-helix transcriptional regulator [Serratia sp. JSRIV006]UAN65792.1 helix-turn-helix transcriptional regulator [Serratia sp. JSRIV006]
MAQSNNERKENIIKNINYLIRSRGETKLSFAERINLTRASLYRILDGKVNNVQHSTVEKVANFFGTTYDVIENSDIEKIELKNQLMDISGNKNPSAVPVIPEKDLLKTLNKPIGELVVKYPLTYHFETDSNIIAMEIGSNHSKLFSIGDILIIKRFPANNAVGIKLILTEDNNVVLDEKFENTKKGKLIGVIIEERL